MEAVKPGESSPSQWVSEADICPTTVMLRWGVGDVLNFTVADGFADDGYC